MSSNTSETRLEPHPFALVFPKMSDKQYKPFLEDVRANGLADPITLFEDKILDGNTRYRACLDAGVKPRFVEWDGQGSPLAFVVSKNRHRRHLTASQRATVAAKLQAALKEEAKANMKKGRQGLANLPNLNSREQASKAVDVSPRLTGSAGMVLKRGTPALVASVERGEIPVSAAAEVANLAAEEQEKVVAGGPKAVRAKAADLRRARTPKTSTNPVPKNKTTGTKAAEAGATSPDEVEAKPSSRLNKWSPLPVPPEVSPAPAADTDEDDEWLESFAIRAQLADARAFDVQALFFRRTQLAYEMARRKHPEFHKGVRGRLQFISAVPMILGQTFPAPSPGVWELCPSCEGKGRDLSGACAKCHGDGFVIPSVDPDEAASVERADGL